MSDFDKYNRLILIALGVISIIIVCLAAYMRPVVGSLTRLGGYLENDFGMNVSQPVFRYPLFTLVGSVEAYDKYSDIVVIGDSFSRAKDIGWQNFLSNATGLSVITFDIQKVTPEAVFSSRTFREYPPRLFIYESVEYAIPLRNSVCQVAGEPVPEPSALDSELDPYQISPLGVRTEQSVVRKSAIFSGHLDLDAAANYLSKMVVRKLLGLDITNTAALELSRSDLFSSSVPDILLVYKNDLGKSSVTVDDIKTAVCSLSELQRRIQANKRTHFLFLPVPDKLSAYSRYLVNEEFADLGIIHMLADSDLNMLRTDKIFSGAVADGVVDLYLPDDNHWSAFGHSIAAGSIFEYLLEIRLLVGRGGVQ